MPMQSARWRRRRRYSTTTGLWSTGASLILLSKKNTLSRFVWDELFVNWDNCCVYLSAWPPGVSNLSIRCARQSIYLYCDVRASYIKKDELLLLLLLFGKEQIGWEHFCEIRDSGQKWSRRKNTPDASTTTTNNKLQFAAIHAKQWQTPQRAIVTGWGSASVPFCASSSFFGFFALVPRLILPRRLVLPRLLILFRRLLRARRALGLTCGHYGTCLTCKMFHPTTVRRLIARHTIPLWTQFNSLSLLLVFFFVYSSS